MSKIHALEAVLFGKIVPFEIMKQRVAICEQCVYSKCDAKGRRFCNLCGCGVSEQRVIFNMARFNESRRWGCKHPLRKRGKGWPFFKMQ